MSVPRVAVSIVTRNRAPVLERTLRELEKLAPPPEEIWVYADACADGTATMVAENFPQIRLLSDSVARGSIYGRDRILREAQVEIVLSLDDDSHPMETDFMARLRALHGAQPKVAVFTFPQRSEEYPETMRDPAPWKDAPPQLVASFTDSGASCWRAAYLELPGFVPEFVHAYEEPDYAVQCFSAGWQVRYEPSLTIRHYYTALNRDPLRTHLFHCRNEVWSVLLRAPWLLIPLMIPFRVLRQVGNAARLGGWVWVRSQPRWWWEALCGAGVIWRKRRAVPWGRYWHWMRLSRRPQPV